MQTKLSQSIGKHGLRATRNNFINLEIHKRSHVNAHRVTVGFGSRPSRNVSMSVSAVDRNENKVHWWDVHGELWQQVESLSEFKSIVMNSKKHVFIDFYSQSCPGCKRTFPGLCKVAADSELRNQYIFLKADAAQTKEILKYLNIRGIPHAQAFRPGSDKTIYKCSPNPSNVKLLRENLIIIASNQDCGFKLDPNGFLKPHVVM